MTTNDLSLDVLLGHLQQLATKSLVLWDIVPAGATARLINVSENATYLVEADGWKSILRVHRDNYHTLTAINTEIAWTEALRKAGDIKTPGVYLGANRAAVQAGQVEGLTTSRFMTMFEFIEGDAPSEDQDLTGPFEELGKIAAIAHNHTIGWNRPVPYERLVWNTDSVFGKSPTWGNWRDAPNVTTSISAILEKVEETIIRRLNNFGKSEQQYGLIHADMRLANLIIGKDGTRLIDFDDCGDGWFLYDFAAGISFIEDRPDIPDLKAAWVKGYRKVRKLSNEEVDEIDTLIMLRRLALLAWIGSHIEAPEPQEMAPKFASITAELGQKYLERFG
ncbi:MAG: Ser/Thr protein kinase RdoA (MazF antagonist) [Parasphingorhabdus sp.]|jgi:Ser/Thr protein kinase RdoA (MazF antagonist)